MELDKTQSEINLEMVERFKKIGMLTESAKGRTAFEMVKSLEKRFISIQDELSAEEKGEISEVLEELENLDVKEKELEDRLETMRKDLNALKLNNESPLSRGGR